MALIKPFKAYRPAKGLEQTVAALPYDVYNKEEARAVVAKNNRSFLAIDRPETQFPDSYDMYAPEVYEKARDMISQWVEEKVFIRDETDCYYLYEQTMDGRTQTGIVACASIDDYLNGVIKKHENTRADKEQDRIRHVDVCNMHTGPIFLAYKKNMTIQNVISMIKDTVPVYDFVSEDGITHRVWIVNETEKIATIKECFDNITDIYIADGHHRCASAVKVGLKRREENPGYNGTEEFNYFLAVLFADEELKILDYNRVVFDLNGLSKECFLAQVFERCDLITTMAEPYEPEKKGTFGMYLDGQWYGLKFKSAMITDDAVDGLDVSLLQNLILGPILGIGDPKTDKRIDFVGGIRGRKELERRVNETGQMSVAFAMYPTTIEELFTVADENRLMPPKSTWFEPKLRSGLFLHELS